jgi:putative oxidoreductase
MLGFGLLVLRVVVGLTVAAHGAQKLFGWFGGPGIGGFGRMLAQLGIRPERPWAVIAALAEFVGGLLVACGLMTPLAALAVSGSMLVAILTVHAGKGFWNMNGGIEFPLIILAAMVAIALTGPGVLSLDHLLSVRLLGPATSFVAALVVLLGVVAALISPKLTSASQSRPQVS